MEKRINVFNKEQQALKSLFAMGNYVNQCSIDKHLQELIKIRVSQINKCAFCLDMHWKDARAMGESEQRLYGLSAWEESPYYTEKERAGLQFAEAVTVCTMPDAVYEEAAKYFSQEELVDLITVANTINIWNRINIAFPKTAGVYQPGQLV